MRQGGSAGPFGREKNNNGKKMIANGTFIIICGAMKEFWKVWGKETTQ